ncbi:hypothetical protein ACLK1T_18155 [Escherichia coli]
MTADEAAELSSITRWWGSGLPQRVRKALPTIARRANEQHEAKSVSIRLLTGASISAAADDAFLTPDAVSWRAPYQTSSGLRRKDQSGRGELQPLTFI